MWIGAIIASIGLLALIAGNRIHYSAHEHLPRDNPTQVTVKEEKALAIPPLAAGATLAAGILIMIVAARR